MMVGVQAESFYDSNPQLLFNEIGEKKFIRLFFQPSFCICRIFFRFIP